MSFYSIAPSRDNPLAAAPRRSGRPSGARTELQVAPRRPGMFLQGRPLSPCRNSRRGLTGELPTGVSARTLLFRGALGFRFFSRFRLGCRLFLRRRPLFGCSRLALGPWLLRCGSLPGCPLRRRAQIKGPLGLRLSISTRVSCGPYYRAITGSDHAFQASVAERLPPITKAREAQMLDHLTTYPQPFDPETITILTGALEDAWRSVQASGATFDDPAARTRCLRSSSSTWRKMVSGTVSSLLRARCCGSSFDQIARSRQFGRVSVARRRCGESVAVQR